jgi:hypothetical protein
MANGGINTGKYFFEMYIGPDYKLIVMKMI